MGELQGSRLCNLSEWVCGGTCTNDTFLVYAVKKAVLTDHFENKRCYPQFLIPIKHAYRYIEINKHVILLKIHTDKNYFPKYFFGNFLSVLTCGYLCSCDCRSLWQWSVFISPMPVYVYMYIHTQKNPTDLEHCMKLNKHHLEHSVMLNKAYKLHPTDLDHSVVFIKAKRPHPTHLEHSLRSMKYINRLESLYEKYIPC